MAETLRWVWCKREGVASVGYTVVFGFIVENLVVKCCYLFVVAIKGKQWLTLFR
jgi:hypothetical protein